MAVWILTRLFNGISNDSAADWEDHFRNAAAENGRYRAHAWFWLQVICSIWAFAVGKIYWDVAMFKDDLRISFRNMLRQKVYSIINMAGLAIGIAVCVLIFLFVEYELKFDTHVYQKEQVFRVVTLRVRTDKIDYSGGTPFPVASAIRNDFPELERVTNIFLVDDAMIGVGEDRFKEHHILFVEPQFFSIFNMEWILGESTNALNDPAAVILTERLASKYFGGTEVVGRRLKLDNAFDLRVTGVLANQPVRTSLPFDMLISSQLLDKYLENDLIQWDAIWSASHTYIRFNDSMDPKDLEERFEAFERKYMEPDYADKWSFQLQPLSDIHFEARYGSYNYVTSHTVLLAFSAIGLLILIIACMNFINLTTAQAMKRAREMGMRKVLGANRIQLIRQLLGETSVMTFLSVLIAVFITWSILPYMNRFLGNQTELSLFSGGGLSVFLGIVFLFVTLVSGFYPALVLSRYQPADALKERLTSHKKRVYVLRNSLVVFQFIISQILIVGTLVIAGQAKYISRMELGFQKKGILTVPIPEYEEARCEALRSRWMQDPRIQGVSFAWSAPVSNSRFRTSFVYEASGDNSEWPAYIKMCDKRYLEIYQIPLIAGRFFERNANDYSNRQWVVNVTAVRRMGLGDPREAIGKEVIVNGLRGEIIGVIRDFHILSMHNEIQSTVFFNFWPENHNEAQIKIDLIDIRHTIDHIRGIWTEYYPDYVFEYMFLDDVLKGLYETESKLLTMIEYSSFVAILIGCMGLLGLVSFMVLQRRKEIGVRKVLGATVSDLYFLISKEFIKWVVFANFIAWPVAYLLTVMWLRRFAYRIDVNAGYFLTAGLISLGIALCVVSYQVIQAAFSNPVETLRYE